jgi:GWxTD domain-containing protein
MNRMKSIVALILAAAVTGMAQPEVAYKEQAPSTIFATVATFASDQPGQSRVDIYAQIPYNELTFVADEGTYLARFEVSAQIRTTDGQSVWQNSQTADLRVKTFAQTVSDRLSQLRQMSTKLAPGAYDLEVGVTDAESKATQTVKRRFEVRDFSKDSVSVSDLLLVSRMTRTENRTSIVPNVSGILFDRADSFYVYLEVYRQRPVDSVSMVYRILDHDGNPVVRSTQHAALTGPSNPFIWRFDSVGATAGQYRVVVDLAPLPRRDSASGWVSASTPLTVRWELLPITIRDIDKAIDQLRYIAKDEEMEYMRGGKDPEERRKRFMEFWSKRDPDPRTPQNELMEEYYARVAYANAHFTTFNQGWKSDMGMVYIKFGPPENIERHPFETDTRPYEVWYYYELNRQFVFVDRSGFGDYRLTYPELDLWGRVR